MEVVRRAKALAELDGCELVVGAEKWAPGWGRKRKLETVVGIGASWGRWAVVLEAAGLGPSVRKVIPDTWRRLVLGNGKASKGAAQAYAKARWGIEATEDEAEALCVAVWRQGFEQLERKGAKR